MDMSRGESRTYGREYKKEVPVRDTIKRDQQGAKIGGTSSK